MVTDSSWWWDNGEMMCSNAEIILEQWLIMVKNGLAQCLVMVE